MESFYFYLFESKYCVRTFCLIVFHIICIIYKDTYIKSLPLEFMTRSNAEMIGNLFDKLLRFESNTRTNIIGTKYLRIQVDTDVRKPLPVDFFHDLGNGGRWISFKYERLPKLCYRCGILGHLNRNCSTKEPATHKILGDLYGI